MQPIVIADVQVSLEDYQRIYKQLHGQHWGWRVLYLIVCTYVIWFEHGSWQVPSLPWLLAYFVVVGGITLQPFVRQRRLKRWYPQTPALFTPTTYFLDEQALYVTRADTTARVSWETIRRVWALPGWWLLLTRDEKDAFLLDATRLQPPASPADVTALLQHRELLS